MLVFNVKNVSLKLGQRVLLTYNYHHCKYKIDSKQLHLKQQNVLYYTLFTFKTSKSKEWPFDNFPSKKCKRQDTSV